MYGSDAQFIACTVKYQRSKMEMKMGPVLGERMDNESKNFFLWTTAEDIVDIFF